jgi:hypothetical protein
MYMLYEKNGSDLILTQVKLSNDPLITDMDHAETQGSRAFFSVATLCQY